MSKLPNEDSYIIKTNNNDKKFQLNEIQSHVPIKITVL